MRKWSACKNIVSKSLSEKRLSIYHNMLKFRSQLCENSNMNQHFRIVPYRSSVIRKITCQKDNLSEK